jgi:hypothetical protein
MTESLQSKAQHMIDTATKNNATLDNVQALLDLLETATKAEPRDLADFFSSYMGGNVPWDRGTSFGLNNLANLLQWRDVKGNGVMITISHAFAAVSMASMPHAVNTAVNHSADIVDGVVKGVIGMTEGRGFSMKYGYGSANQAGDSFGNYMALELGMLYADKLSVAFRTARKKMNV